MTILDKQGQLFISYAREDKPVVADVVEGLERLGKDVWLDEEMLAGQAWWDEILEHIRDCDVFLQIISQAAVDSEACHRERRYARQLGKPVLPIIVEHLHMSLLPADLATLQCLQYDASDPQHAFELIGALERCDPPRPLPDPLPDPPPIPVSYLGQLGDRVRAETLSQDEQAALVSRLRPALSRPDQAESARELLQRLQDRPDVFYAVARDIEAALRDARAASAVPTTRPAVSSEPAPSAPPPPPSSSSVTVPTHMRRAVVAAILLLPLGIFAVIAAAKVPAAVDRGDLEAAMALSRRANVLFWVTVAIMALLFVTVA